MDAWVSHHPAPTMIRIWVRFAARETELVGKPRPVLVNEMSRLVTDALQVWLEDGRPSAAEARKMDGRCVGQNRDGRAVNFLLPVDRARLDMRGIREVCVLGANEYADMQRRELVE